MLATEAAATVETLRRLQTILNNIGAGQDIESALDAVAHAVVDVGGFHVACANLVDGDELVAVAVAGPPEARTALLGDRWDRAVWDRLLVAGEAWGGLRYHRDPRELLAQTAFWVPPVNGQTDTTSPNQWGPYNALFAPMYSATGELIAVLSVDQPADGLVPDRAQCELLEIFVVQAGLAIDNHRLARDLEAEHQRLRTSEQTLRLAFDNAPVGMCLVRPEPDGAGQILRGNEALARMFGYPEADLTALRVTALTEPDPDEGDQLMLDAAAAGTIESYRSECRCVRADGSTFWGQVHVAVLPSDTDGPLVLAQFVDVTARRESEAELAHRAAHDSLTGLVNRSVTAERLARLLEGPRDAARPGAVLFCDLDHFKQVNDAHGHLIGDEVLASVARRIAGVVRRSDTVGRYGGDEFLVIVPEISPDEAREMAIRIVRAVDEPIVVGGMTCRVGASVGVVVLSTAKSAADVLERADEAMYRAKTRFGRDRYVIHDQA